MVTATETGYADQTLEIQLAATPSGGITSYVPDPITSANVANYVLVLYNADSTAASDLKDYYGGFGAYLGQGRPGMHNATYLPISAAILEAAGYNLQLPIGVTTLPDTGGSSGALSTSYASQAICSAIEGYVESYIETHSQIRYVLGLCGLPSRVGASVDNGGASVLYTIYNDVVTYTEGAGPQYPQYSGQRPVQPLRVWRAVGHLARLRQLCRHLRIH